LTSSRRNPEEWLFNLNHNWRNDAACSALSGDQAEIFFELENHRSVAQAKRVCAGCPVFDDCRAWIDGFEEQSPRGDPTYFGQLGIWAGETPRERTARRRGRRIPVITPTPRRGQDGHFANRWSRDA
jgi:transcription factor WhiB